MRFFFQPEFSHGSRTGASVIVIVGPRWTRFLLSRMGLTGAPFFERVAFTHEPENFPNGQPFAWVYRNPSQASADEARWLDAADLARFTRSLNEAQSRTALPAQGPIPESTECAA